jgi:putative MATE family efflux protein
LAAASRSIGDTLTPLICLVAGSLVNVGLDLLFVARFAWGVAGAAWATVISQALASALCAWLLRRNEPMLFAGQGDFVPDRALFGRTLRFSAPSAMQQAGVYVGKLLVQSAVNPLGVSAIAAFNAVNRIDDYALIPERDIASGETVLVAQNHGAGHRERMLRGLYCAMALEIAYGLIVSVAVFLLAAPLMRLFVDPSEAEVIRLGARYLRLMGLFYIMPGITNGLQGYMRALGKLKLTMAVTYAQMFTRAAFTFLLIGPLALDAVPLACAAGWTLMVVWEVGLIVKWRREGKL